MFAFLDSMCQHNILALFFWRNLTHVCSNKLTLSFWLSLFAEINRLPCQLMGWPTRSLLKKCKKKLCKLLRYILTPEWTWFALPFPLSSFHLKSLVLLPSTKRGCDSRQRRKKKGKWAGGIWDAYYNLSRGENDTSFSTLRSTRSKSIKHSCSHSLWPPNI